MISKGRTQSFTFTAYLGVHIIFAPLFHKAIYIKKKVLLDDYNIGCHYTYMGARLVYHTKEIYKDESILEIKIWQVPRSERYPFGYKYSFVYIQKGTRVIGYDNAEGKGDHKHLYDQVTPYSFTGLDQLFEEFLADVKRISGFTFD